MQRQLQLVCNLIILPGHELPEMPIVPTKTLSGEIRVRRNQAGTGFELAEERRAKPRINEPFPSKVSGIDIEGHAFEMDCLLDNISSGGLYLRLPKKLKAGSEMKLIISFSKVKDTGATARVLGEILRTDLESDGCHGIAVSIKEHQFL